MPSLERLDQDVLQVGAGLLAQCVPHVCCKAARAGAHLDQAARCSRKTLDGAGQRTAQQRANVGRRREVTPSPRREVKLGVVPVLRVVERQLHVRREGQWPVTLDLLHEADRERRVRQRPHPGQARSRCRGSPCTTPAGA